MRRGQRVRERGDEWSLGVQDVGERLARVRGPQTRELCQRRGMERARLHLVDLERAEPSLELTCRLVGECDGEDLRGLERSAHDLTGDPMRDGGRLPRPGAGQDRDRPAGASAASRWDSFRPASTLSRSGTRPTLASDRRPPAVIEILPRCTSRGASAGRLSELRAPTMMCATGTEGT